MPQEFGYCTRFTLREFVEYMAWLRAPPESFDHLFGKSRFWVAFLSRDTGLWLGARL